MRQRCKLSDVRPRPRFSVGDQVWAGHHGVALFLLGKWRSAPLRGRIAGLSYLQAVSEWFYEVSLADVEVGCRFPESALTLVSLLDVVAEAAEDD